jgi:hypothetical protein
MPYKNSANPPKSDNTLKIVISFPYPTNYHKYHFIRDIAGQKDIYEINFMILLSFLYLTGRNALFPDDRRSACRFFEPVKTGSGPCPAPLIDIHLRLLK